MSDYVKISSWSKRRLEEQGYRSFTADELLQYRFAIRFAYVTCMSMVIIGLVFKSQLFLLIANGIAILGMLPPNHPIDYLYNYGVRYLIGRPKLPPRPTQSRFACAMATIMLAVINYFFTLGNFTVVYVVGAVLLSSAFMVSFIDLCIPSKIYNALFDLGAEQSSPGKRGETNAAKN